MVLRQTLEIVVPAVACFVMAALIGVAAFGDPVINSYTIASFFAGGVAGAGTVLAGIRGRAGQKKPE
jgi:hypothetical protein